MTDKRNNVSRGAPSAGLDSHDREGSAAMSPSMLKLVLSFGGVDADRTDPHTWLSRTKTAEKPIRRRRRR